MKMYLNALYRVLFVLSVITIQFSETAIQKRLFQKMDDLEFEMRKENLQRHEEIRELRQIVNRMEEHMNNSMTILDRQNSEISDTDSQSHQVKTEQLDSRKIAEVLRTFKILKRGFSEEKKVTSRLRRHVTKMQSEIVDQQNISRELSKGVTNILEAVTTVSDILNDMKNENTGIKEKVKILSSEISTSNQRFSRIEEALNKIQPQLVEQRTASLELSKDVTNILGTETTVSNVLNNLKNEIKDIKENGIIRSSEISTSNQRFSRIEEALNKIQPQLVEQRIASIELSKDVTSILGAETTVSNVLNNLKSEITDIKENGIIMSAGINTSNERCSQIDETFTTEITKSLDFLKITRQKMEAFHNEMQMSGCRKDDITELQNQLNYKCEGAHYTSCKKIHKAGCTLSGVYKLSLETGTEQVIHKLAAWFKI